MKILVDKMPESCEECPYCWTTSFDVDDGEIYKKEKIEYECKWARNFYHFKKFFYDCKGVEKCPYFKEIKEG